MAIAIPQDIIDSIIEVVGDDSSLKQCALVSSSFLLPSRRHLFSKITLSGDQACQRLYQLLINNPVVRSFIRSIIMEWSHEMSGSNLISVLRLPFCRLESFSMVTVKLGLYFSTWNRFSRELRDSLSSISHLSTLKTLHISRIDVPIMFFQGMHLMNLMLDSFMPNDFDGGLETSHPVIDQCLWRFSDLVIVPTKQFLPFMCRLRVFKIYVDQFSISSDFLIASFLLRSLRISLTSPATLEHLEIFIEFNNLDTNLREADVWRHLDSITTHPIGSRLQRVDVNIIYSLHHDIYASGAGPDETELIEPILNALPLLQEKGILFVEASVSPLRKTNVPVGWSG